MPEEQPNWPSSRPSFIYLPGMIFWADRAFQNLESVFEDEGCFFDNPVAAGLTRAAIVAGHDHNYDFCYQSWSQQERNLVTGSCTKNLICHPGPANGI